MGSESGPSIRGTCEDKVGAVLSIEASRLARNGRGWHTLLEFCSVVGALFINAEGIYDPRQIPFMMNNEAWMRAFLSVTGLDLHELSGMVGRQLPFFFSDRRSDSFAAFAGWRGMLGE